MPRQVYLLLIKPAFAGRTLQTFRHLHACSGCFRLERCRAGLTPAGKRRLCTAHARKVQSSEGNRMSATRRGPAVHRIHLAGSSRPQTGQSHPCTERSEPATKWKAIAPNLTVRGGTEAQRDVIASAVVSSRSFALSASYLLKRGNCNGSACGNFDGLPRRRAGSSSV